MSDHTHREIQDLRISVLMLTDRVDQLERAASIEPAPAPGPAPVAPPVATARVVPPPRPSRPAPPPRQPRPPRDWGKLAEQLFAARTLAWAGGVATTLGVVLLFVMATSRGWITPSMRVGIGMAVSLLVLVAAVEFDRRKWRADAILAAGGVGIAGLYTTLWAATSVYHLISAPAAAPLSALIAAIAVGLAIRIRQEPLAVFGMSAAMVAPVVVSHDVTAGGVLFAAVMIAAALPLFLRLRWRTLVAALWAIGFAETLVLLAVSHAHHGFTSAVIATAVVAALFIAVTFALELTRSTRTSVSWLASIIAGSAFTLSLGAAFLYAGERQVNGHSLAGLALIVVALAWAVLAAVPTLARRPHVNLTDGLVAFALAALAIATGLLAGGPALVCAWAAESAMLIALAERAARRDVRRRPRLVISAGIYLDPCNRRHLADRRTVGRPPDRDRRRVCERRDRAGRDRHRGGRVQLRHPLAQLRRTADHLGIARDRTGIPACVGAARRVGRGGLRRHGGGDACLPPIAGDDRLDARRGHDRRRRRLVALGSARGCGRDRADPRARPGLEDARRRRRSHRPGRTAGRGSGVRVVGAPAAAPVLGVRAAGAGRDVRLPGGRGARRAVCDVGVARGRQRWWRRLCRCPRFGSGLGWSH